MAALLMQTFLFQQSLKRQIRTESIADNENTLTKMQAELMTFVRNIRTEMLTIYSEYDLIEELRSVAKGSQERCRQMVTGGETGILEESVFLRKTV